MDIILLAILVIWYCGYSSACCSWLLFDFRFFRSDLELTIDTRQHGSVPGIYHKGGVHDAQAYGEGVEQWCSSVST